MFGQKFTILEFDDVQVESNWNKNLVCDTLIVKTKEFGCILVAIKSEYALLTLNISKDSRNFNF